MRAVVQRVTEASVKVSGRTVGEIKGPGLLVLVGVTHDDTSEKADRLAEKLWNLRLLDDEKSCADLNAPLLVLVGVTHDDTSEKADRLAEKLWNLRLLDDEKSCADLNAPLLIISQFTLYGDARKGRRPTWQAAAPGPVAEPLVNAVVEALRRRGARVETGQFGAHMLVSLVNDGPVTLILEV